MPSATRQKSYNSVIVYSMDKSRIWAALEELVEDLGARSEVLAVILFGSLVRGDFGVGSDVDILILLDHSDQPFLERLPLYRPQRFPVDIDVFPYTLAEWHQGISLARQALQEGRTLWQRPGFSLPELPSRSYSAGENP